MQIETDCVIITVKGGASIVFFAQENIPFMILDVQELYQAVPPSYNAKRRFNALSFRYESDAVIETDNKVCHLTDNAICFVPANVNYTRSAKKDHVIVVHFLYFGEINLKMEYFYPENAEKYRKSFLRLFKVWQEKDVAYKMKAAAVLYEIFADIFTECRRPVTKNPLLSGSVDYLLKNYCSPELSIEQLAEIAHMSEVYFRKLFKEEFGVSPKKYIVDLRIKYAAELISSGYYSLSEVCAMAGFTDYKHFSVTFKEKLGCSPSQYLSEYEKHTKLAEESVNFLQK